MLQAKNIARSSVALTLISVINIAVNFGAQLVVAYFFGATQNRDAYFVAIGLSNYLSAIFIGAIGTVFMPRLVDLRVNGKPEDVCQFVNASFSWTGLGLGALVMLGMIFAEPIVRLTAFGLNASQIKLTASLLQVVFPGALFLGLSYLLSSIYQAEGHFVWPGLMTIVVSTCMIVSNITLNHSFGIYSLAIGFLSGTGIAFVLQLPVIRGFRPFFKRDHNVIAMLKVAVPLFLSGILFRSTTVVERMIASTISIGAISYMGYGNQIVAILNSLTSNGIATSMYPLLSEGWANNDTSAIQRYVHRSMNIIAFVVVFISGCFILYGTDIVQIVFERGAFIHKDTIAVSSAVAVLMAAYLFQSLGTIVPKNFYIRGRSDIVLYVGIAELATYLLSAWVLVPRFGYIGLAYAIVLSTGISIALASILVDRLLVRIRIGAFTLKLMRTILSAGVAFGVVWYLGRFAESWIPLVRTSIGIGLAAVLYLLIVSFVFRHDEVRFLFNTARQ